MQIEDNQTNKKSLSLLLSNQELFSNLYLVIKGLAYFFPPCFSNWVAFDIWMAKNKTIL